ncbi:hypothetical protein ES703_44526 [subsurface metagenome]
MQRILLKDSEKLLIDHSRILEERLLSARRIDIILDNAGHELVCDLIFISYLLSLNNGRTVALHVKKSPFYVSDATRSDVEKTIDTLAQHPRQDVSEKGLELASLHRQKRLLIMEHFFWNGLFIFRTFPRTSVKNFPVLIWCSSKRTQTTGGCFQTGNEVKWPDKPYVVRLAPPGWKKEHLEHSDPAQHYPEEAPCSVSDTESRSTWAKLIAQVYEVDPLECPRCRSLMKVIAVITEPEEVRKILKDIWSRSVAHLQGLILTLC